MTNRPTDTSTPKKTTTHYAAIDPRTRKVLGVRSSESRHAAGSGKFGPYTHAVASTGHDGERPEAIISYAGSAALAAATGRTFTGYGHRGIRIVPVVITASRASVGAVLEDSPAVQAEGGAL